MIDRVDVHKHFLPDFHQRALADAGVVHPDGMAAVPGWSEAEALATMNRLGVATACLSISSPGVRFAGPAAAIDLARRTNTEAARLVAAHPGRFAFFAVTPLPDVSAALAEVGRAFDELGAAGVVLETNFEGVYLGDDLLEPLYEELDRRGAVVFVHPTSPHCSCTKWTICGPRSADLTFGYPAPTLEFMFETTRTVTNMMLSGTLERHPHMRLIVPHAGACLPTLAGRIQLLKDAGPHRASAPDVDVRRSLQRLHFDLAGAPVPEALGALLRIVPPAHLHYGSDWPFTPADACETLLDELIACDLLSHGDRDAMFGANARRLLDPSPRLRDACAQA